MSTKTFPRPSALTNLKALEEPAFICTSETTDQYALNFLSSMRPIAAPGIRTLQLIQRLSEDGVSLYDESTENQKLIHSVLLPRKSKYEHGEPQTLAKLVGEVPHLTDTGQELLSVIQPIMRGIAHNPASAGSPALIIINGGLSWVCYALLWDAVHRDTARDHKTRKLGSIKRKHLETIVMLGLGYEIRFPQKVGRPYVGIMPTRWGVKLVQLLDNQGLTLPEEAREYARYSSGRKSATALLRAQIEDEYRRLGIVTKSSEPEEALSTRKYFEQTNMEERLKQEFGPPDPDQPPEPEKEPFVIDHRDIPEDWDKEA